MYQKFAAVYDAIYSFKDYAAESEKIAAIAAEKQPAAKSLLDVACGSGAHLQHLRAHYACTGLDLSEDLLTVAREKLPDVQFAHGDMRTFDLGRQFDVVTCLFAAIGYMTTLSDLRLAIANMAKHVASGGVMIIEPWITRENFRSGLFHLMTAETETMKIARANTSRIEGDTSVMDFHFMVVSKDGVDLFEEEHRMGLFRVEDHIAAFEDAGMSAAFDEQGLIGRGLYVAVKK